MLVRLLYASHATEMITPHMVNDILAAARVENTARGVTGILCHSGDNFIQVLEGGRRQVSTLYNKIATDPRHTEVVLLHYEEITERRFAEWTMGQVNLARLNPAMLLKYSDVSELDPYTISGRAAVALLDDLIASASIICRVG